MKIFILDLWHDLREKRLWPVALVLAIALVAVPVVLSKPGAAPPPPAAPPEVAQDEQNLKGLAKVVLAQQQEGRGSKLNLFDSSDPFKPPKSATEKEGGEVGTEGTTPPGGATGTDTTGGGTPAGGGVAGEGTGSPTSPTEPQPSPSPKLIHFKYVVDATLKHDGRTRKIKGMDVLEMLPGEKNPLLVLLGVRSDANSVVFLVGDVLQLEGEGSCKPSNDKCSYLLLKVGERHIVTDRNDESYVLRIDAVRRVEIKPKSQSSKAKKAEKAKKSERSSSDRGRTQSAKQTHPYVPPLLVDLVGTPNDEFER